MRGHRHLSNSTLGALASVSGDYVSKEHDELAYIEKLKKKYSLKKIYRFDIGKNTDGFSPRVHQALCGTRFQKGIVEHTVDYPDNQYKQLRWMLSQRYGVSPDWFTFGAGVESVIDHIARAVFNPEDSFLFPVPNFSVFEDMSLKLGTHAEIVPIGRSLQWTEQTTQRVIHAMKHKKPRLLWLSSPINPIGIRIRLNHIEKMVQAGEKYGVWVVVDEAYGEYTDHDYGCITAAGMVAQYENLIVLRTFSKMFGLAGARVGYMISSCAPLRTAVDHYRPTFPMPWTSLYLAQVALEDEAYVRHSRRKLAQRRDDFFKKTKSLDKFKFLPTEVNTVMFRHVELGAGTLTEQLQRRGILTANLDGLTGLQGQGFLRMTLRSKADNAYFIKTCHELVKPFATQH